MSGSSEGSSTRVSNAFSPFLRCSLALACGLLALCVAVTSPAGASTPSAAQGVYVGAGNPIGVAQFATKTGVNVTLASDYLVGTAGFASMVGSSGNPPFPLTSWRGSKYRLVVGIPMNPDAGANSTVLADGAAGDYNSYFVTLAKNAVAVGEGNIIWRPGWEFDQGLVVSAQNATNYAAYYRNIVTSMRSVSGQSFQFTWDGALDGTANGNAWTTLQAYPGDSYVDYVALDFYDTTWTSKCALPFDNAFSAAQQACVWKDDQSARLGTLASFATAHNKPMAFPEWGVDSRSDGHGGGDDPTYIDDMAYWIANHNVAFDSYFDFNSGGDSVLTDYPSSLAAYKAVFTGGTPAITPPAQARAITSSVLAGAIAGSPVTFTVTTSGTPVPTIKRRSALPRGLRFTDNHNGTATLAGTPIPSRRAKLVRVITIAAIYGRGSTRQVVTQKLVLILEQPAAITNKALKIGKVGQKYKVTVRTQGLPTPSLSEAGALPNGVTFVSDGAGTATLIGTPPAGSATEYPIVITASNGAGSSAAEPFTLSIKS